MWKWKITIERIDGKETKAGNISKAKTANRLPAVSLPVVITEQLPKSKVGMGMRTEVTSALRIHTISKYKKFLLSVFNICGLKSQLSINSDKIINDLMVSLSLGTSDKKMIGLAISIAISDLKQLKVVGPSSSKWPKPIVSSKTTQHLIKNVINSNTTRTSWKYQGFNAHENVVIAMMAKKGSMSKKSFLRAVVRNVGLNELAAKRLLGKFVKKSIVEVSKNVNNEVVTLMMSNQEEKIEIKNF